MTTINSRPIWLHGALCRRFGEENGSALCDRVQRRYDELLAQPSPFVDPRETALAADEVLPLVALYQTLRADGLSFEAAETEVRRVQAQHLHARRVPGLEVARHLPLSSYWLRRIVQREVTAAFPAPAFKTVLVEDGGDRLTFAVKRCLYRAALAAYGAPELTATFCRFDEIRFERLANAVTCVHQPECAGADCRFCFTLAPDRAGLEEAEEYLAL